LAVTTTRPALPLWLLLRGNSILSRADSSAVAKSATITKWVLLSGASRQIFPALTSTDLLAKPRQRQSLIPQRVRQSSIRYRAQQTKSSTGLERCEQELALCRLPRCSFMRQAV